MRVATPQDLQELRRREREHARQHPIAIGHHVTLNGGGGWYHAHCEVVEVRPKAVKLQDRTGSGRWAWFPLSGVEQRVHESMGGTPIPSQRSMDVLPWLDKQLNRYQEKLLGLVD